MGENPGRVQMKDTDKGSAVQVRTTGRRTTLSSLRRIGAYLWIGLVNPGPPREQRKSSNRGAPRG